MCQHHYEVESSRKPKVKGVCIKCGEEREFDNYIDPTINPNVNKDVHITGGNSSAYWEQYVEYLARDL